jgi:hypothetical protein
VDAIVTTATPGPSNAQVEAANKTKLITKMTCGSNTFGNLFSIAMLKCSNPQAELPGRTT